MNENQNFLHGGDVIKEILNDQWTIIFKIFNWYVMLIALYLYRVSKYTN